MNGMNDGWDAVPLDDNVIRGSMLKFIDGEWADRDTGDVLNGKQFAVVGVLVSWDHWVGGDVTHDVTKPGQLHPKRSDLPDQDETQWEPGLDGKPADPRQDARYVYLVDQQSAAEFTFVTKSKGGRSAVSALRNQLANMRTAHPRAVAVVELLSQKMKTDFGTKAKPWLKVVGWINGAGKAPGTIEGQAAPPAPPAIEDRGTPAAPARRNAAPTTGESRGTKKARKKPSLDHPDRKAQLDDDIPFDPE
jgi:hypothetical protein